MLFGKLTAVTEPVVLLRACLDRNTRTLTLYYTPKSDVCGSFTEYIAYGRESASQPYQTLHTHGVLTDQSFSFVIPNTKKWEVYITTKNACNRIDSLNSNSVLIDDTPPNLHNIDSVSVRLTTQKLYAGWSNAPEPDVKGYTLFKSNPGAGTNSVLRSIQGESDSFLSSTFDVNQKDNFLSIAVFDSCGNEGIISNPHSPVFIEHNSLAFNDLCDKKTQIRWSNYIAPGWVDDSYDLFVGTRKDNLTLVAKLPGGTNSYDFTIPTPGLEYLFYIRVHKQGSTITSSSNLISVKTTSNPVSTNNRIGHVTFIEPGKTEISMLLDPKLGVKELLLYQREKGSTTWDQVYTNNNPQAYNSTTETGLDNSNKIYEYKSALTNVCDDTFELSPIHESIVLNKADFVFTWNDYAIWNIRNAYFQRSNQLNDLTSQTNNNTLFQNDSDPLAWTQYQVVYYHTNATGSIDSARSNYIRHLVFDTTLIPNVFNPFGPLNKTFKISNPNIRQGESIMRIYNRWGQKIWNGDALLGWNGTHYGKLVPHGTYIYTVLINRAEKAEQLKGTLQLLR